MDTEERPSKMRKLSHDNDTPTEDVTSKAPPSHPAAEPTTSNENNSHPSPAPEATSDQDTDNDNDDPTKPNNTSDLPQPSQLLSKSAQKKLRKRQEWESNRDHRRLKRKEKAKERKDRKRSQRELEAQQHEANGTTTTTQKHHQHRPIRLPVTFLIDCGFDDKMTEKEKISLGSQLTRAYADNSRAVYQGHLAVSSWGGELKERFETVLGGQYHNWKGVTFTQEDFVGAAEEARKVMSGPQGGRMEGSFKKYAKSDVQNNSEPVPATTEKSEEVSSPALPALPPPEIVYLTSESPNTLTSLRPNSTYIIGGIVDKNRHKGLCYRLACDRGIKTAKLPIGKFMEMQSRFVLATNHVVEIMVRWLECGDWGESFMKVIPKRKGGRLKGREENDGDGDEVEIGDEDECESVVVEDRDGDRVELDDTRFQDAHTEKEESKVEEGSAGTMVADQAT